MGQQQLLLLVLGVIIVGIAVVMGINLFRSNAIDSKRNLITNECINLASMAQQHYRRPAALGGGGGAFDNSMNGIKWSIPSALVQTAAGDYSLTEIAPQQITIVGTGNEVVNGVDQVKVSIVIKPDSYQVTDLSSSE